MHKELIKLEEDLKNCQACPLGSTRTNMVFGKGGDSATVMLVGEGPGADEDRQGVPFVGRAGQLLDKILEAAELPPEDIYIANVVKCRPPQNRQPRPEEIVVCKAFLREQIKIIAPKIIVCLGAVSTQLLVSPEARITKTRGQWVKKGAFLIMPTFHPAALLRDVSKKKDVWQDMQAVRDEYRRIKGIMNNGDADD